MDLMEAIQARHSVRTYTDRPIGDDLEWVLRQAIGRANESGGLHTQLCLDEPQAFQRRLGRYGRFVNCRNYLVMAGPRGTDEALGYQGQHLVLLAQQLGLNSCWVGLHYSKTAIPADLRPGDRIRLVVALGYGQTQGRPRRSRPLEELCQTEGPMPDWFRSGMEAAMLAPTALNQQKFRLTLAGRRVTAHALPGFYSRLDLGIVKCHFEIGAFRENFEWA